MSNYEYDKLYDELQELEEKLGTRMANSPTVNVGYEVLSELPKERHERPMLSLDKTKDVERLKEFLGGQKALISWKLDGLTVVLTYQNGELVKAVTRGNGVIGEVITNNAKVFKNVPLKIPYQGELVLRGEAVISYKDFEKINEEIEDVDAKYKNPRNLCSGSVRQLNNEITAKRNVRFYAFTLVRAEGVDFQNSRKYQMQWLENQGFDVVENHEVTRDTIEEEVAWFAREIEHNEVPSDGLVLVYDDIAYGQSLGTTAKFPRDSFAFKWADEIRNTKLYCTNPKCQAKHVKSFALFVSRDAMNIEGLSEATLEKFIFHGYVKDFIDLFHLDNYRDEIMTMDGFGEKSFLKLQSSIEKARKTTLARLVYGLGIPGIGSANAKVICRALGNDSQRVLQAEEAELVEIQGVGAVMAKSYVDYFKEQEHQEIFKRLLSEVELEEEEVTEDSQKFAGVNFVITGSVEHFANRAEVKAEIEKRGGKVTGSVTSKTNYLINNDVNSTSSKNKKARDLGVPIISEKDFLEML